MNLEDRRYALARIIVAVAAAPTAAPDLSTGIRLLWTTPRQMRTWLQCWCALLDSAKAFCCSGLASFWYFACHSARSEEHTSELQSLMRISYAVFCLKKKKKQQHT